MGSKLSVFLVLLVVLMLLLSVFLELVVLLMLLSVFLVGQKLHPARFLN